MRQFFNILRLLLSLIHSPQQIWQRLGEKYKDEESVDSLMKEYFSPLLGGGALVLFVAKGLLVENVSFSWEHAIKGGVTFLIGYYGGLFLAEFLVKEALRLFEIEVPKMMLRACVILSMSYCLALDVVLGCLPSFSFFLVLGIYLCYIVWCAMGNFLQLEERAWWRATIITSIVIFFSPRVIQMLLSMMEGAGQ